MLRTYIYIMIGNAMGGAGRFWCSGFISFLKPWLRRVRRIVPAHFICILVPDLNWQPFNNLAGGVILFFSVRRNAW